MNSSCFQKVLIVAGFKELNDIFSGGFRGVGFRGRPPPHPLGIRPPADLKGLLFVLF